MNWKKTRVVYWMNWIMFSVEMNCIFINYIMYVTYVIFRSKAPLQLTLPVATCSQYVHHMFITCSWHVNKICSQHVHHIFRTCSPHFHDMFTTFSPHVDYMFTTLHVKHIFTTCSQHVHHMFTTCPQHVHHIFIACSQHVHNMFITWSPTPPPTSSHPLIAFTRKIKSSILWTMIVLVTAAFLYLRLNFFFH